VDEIMDRASAEAEALTKVGFHGILVENYGDTPFFPEGVPPVTSSTMAVVARELVKGTQVPVGVNVLRNDAEAALGVALASGARFIRVNVHTGTMFTDQGLIHGRAHKTLRLRAALEAEISILADVLVKHAIPPQGLSLQSAARDTWLRGHADGVILTGAETGSPLKPTELEGVRRCLPSDAKIWVGSGANPDTVGDLLDLADGVIVGSALRTGGLAGAPMDPSRIESFMEAVRRR
jgi:membrane complex biogenesis BtpA family protein